MCVCVHAVVVDSVDGMKMHAVPDEIMHDISIVSNARI